MANFAEKLAFLKASPLDTLEFSGSINPTQPGSPDSDCDAKAKPDGDSHQFDGAPRFHGPPVSQYSRDFANHRDRYPVFPLTHRSNF